MNHDTDSDSGDAPEPTPRPNGRRAHVPALPARGPFPPALGPPMATAVPPLERTPAAELSVSPRNVYVTVELPGATKDSLDIEATGTTLRVVAPRVGGPAYRLEVDLPTRVDPASAKSTCRNGILDITLARASGGETHED